ncbi:GNAT family N-acetyltransferase [Paraflavitalea pollutisoli]|uniref:GNAT family N-acetyltransferase n=1 Tax=Paraflavitalea pollutisoli TaxID=3034143 RepID=UPI0023EBB08B|nr:GNAT family N-acetyltransferase [Paraflavitalea sp. H1-2-19X]
MSNSDKQGEALRQATDEQLEQAVAANHQQLFVSNATALGGTVYRDQGLVYTHTANNGAEVAFPKFNGAEIGVQLDRMMQHYRHLEAGHIGFWSLYPAQPPDLGAYLLARGFQPGWWPYWMVLEPSTLREGFNTPGALAITPDNDTAIVSIAGLPYGDGGAFTPALLGVYPVQAQRFLARINGQVVGQTCLFFTEGLLGIAGMYNVGVLPTHQRQGIGKALVIAASQFAFAKGYRYVMLNANHIGRRTYEQVGFRFVGMGRTWWIVNKNYLRQTVSPGLTALAEATGRGAIAAMEKAYDALTKEELDQALPNGMTVMQVAAYFKQQAAAQWLIDRQATCSPLDAWDLGWHQQAADILRQQPGIVNRTYLDYRGTLLHVAADRNDMALARLALDAGIDLQILDAQYQATGLGWAQHLGRFALITLIKEKMS